MLTSEKKDCKYIYIDSKYIYDSRANLQLHLSVQLGRVAW